MKKGTVFDIQRMSVHDGPGIRTTVFLKGCPLRCIWCHNPESHKKVPELAFYENQCIGCGECFEICSNHEISDGKHRINRECCICCGNCTDSCTGALHIIGKTYGVDDVMKEVRKDLRFYEASGGGLTVSGGEPLMQADFTTALLKKAREENIHTCLETTGYVKQEILLNTIPYVDLYLYDYKETDSKRHLEFTSGRNELILDNLFALDARGASVILRCPIIPGLNDREDHLCGIAETANRMKNIRVVHIEPYNRFGEGKCDSLGKEYALKGLKTPDSDTVEQWISYVQERTSVTVRKS